MGVGARPALPFCLGGDRNASRGRSAVKAERVFFSGIGGVPRQKECFTQGQGGPAVLR
jgi:hypothetical protein